MTKINPKKIFNSEIEFILGAHNFSQIPQHHYPELAFIGASNVGKSSLINAIFSQKIAIVSSTPGRTQQLNFFKINGFKDGFVIVDLPGYGYAKAQQKKIQHWQDTTFDYLLNRPNLVRIFLLVDGIKGLKNHDLEVIEFFYQHQLDFQIILTKIDKINLDFQKKSIQEINHKIEIISKKNISNFNHKIILSSNSKGYGIFDIQNEIIEILQNL